MATTPPQLPDLAKYPRMTGWFGPILLIKLLGRVIVSDLFGQYADRRLILAGLDTVSPEDLFKRAQKFMPGQDNEEVWTFIPDADGAVWIDFVADLGDGFDATYAIASLLSQEKLIIDGHTTPRGQLLIMGGDEVYPNATREAYRQKLRDPYGWAFPDPHPKLLKGPPVYAIPGNHDWYDGLVQFLALFSRQEHLHLGGWRTHQRRSYFALQLTPTWWVWAMDAQLDDDIDQPQKDYFVHIAKQMPHNANIILCGPEPGWLYTLKKGSESFKVIDYVAWIALNHCPGAKIPLVISGDTHHYSRYEGDDGTTQFITSGGGGAFLHPTHQLAQSIDVHREQDGITWMRGEVKNLNLAAIPARKGRTKHACYPTKANSFVMLAGNLVFPIYNPGFGAVLGVAYWLLGLVALAFPCDALYVAPLVLGLGFWGYTHQQEGGGAKVILVSIANGIAHAAALIVLANLFRHYNLNWVDPAVWPRTAFWLFAVEMIFLGGTVAAEMFGIYLCISSGLLNLNHNDAFSSMRRNSHRHFMRLRICGEELTLYPIGLDRVPNRGAWRKNSAKQGLPPPDFVPASPLAPHLIEPPITLRVQRPPKDGVAPAAVAHVR
jgi:hypothetical protein